MGPYGSVGAHIKTGKRSMAYDHFWTPPDPKMAHKNPKNIKKIQNPQKMHFLGILDFFDIFWIFMGHFWVGRGPEMIVCHRPLTSLNMSPYRAIWTHFRPISIFFIHLIRKICRHLGHVFFHSPRIPHRSTTDLGEIHHN